MAYRCPVCDVLQPDGEHLANHLAITAMLDRTAHAEWLAAHAPDFEEMNPSELAAQITPALEPVDEDEDTTTPPASPGFDWSEGPTDGASFEHAIQHQAGRGRTAPGAGRADLDPDTRAVLAEAQELTAAMLSEESGASGDDEADPDEDDPEQPTDDDGAGSS
jgi:hypothetical protein